jgi:hypothetical protein
MSNNDPKPEKKPDDKPEPITYTLDGEPYTTTDRTLTPREILSKAGIELTAHYLVELHGNSGERTSYEGRMGDKIHMHPNMKFLALSTGPTTVS